MASASFDGADDDELGPEWVPLTGWYPFHLFTNEAEQDITGENSAERYQADTPPDDQYSSVNLGIEFIDPTLDKGAGPAWRMSASDSTCYFAIANTHASGHYQYGKLVANVITFLGTYSAGAVPTPGAGLEGQAEGTRISMWVDGVEVAFTTDAAIASGNCGIIGIPWITRTTLNNWVGAGLAAEIPEASLTWLVPIGEAA